MSKQGKPYETQLMLNTTVINIIILGASQFINFTSMKYTLSEYRILEGRKIYGRRRNISSSFLSFSRRKNADILLNLKW
ncbi:hypothetical protein RB195_014228 [Necator americanus]|uniref:Uncharacterized protein n=1 Tax=Necator americanus TaxID=51031 RepID=A0ABR1DZB9_NECAM